MTPTDSQPKTPLAERISSRFTWLAKMRLQAIVAVIGIPLAVFSIFSVGLAWAALPVIGVSIAVVSLTVSKLGSRFEKSTCWTCGTDLALEPAGVHGVICPSCGSLNQHNPRLLAMGDRSNDDERA